MSGRKLTGLALAILFVAAFSIQPASAGLGGCRSFCGPQHATTISVGKTHGAANYVIDSLKFFLPTNVVAWLRGVTTGTGHAKTQGLGGCFFGCKL